MNAVLVARQPANRGEVPVKTTADQGQTNAPDKTLTSELNSLNLKADAAPGPRDQQKEIAAEAGKEFKEKLNPDKVEREVGPSLWAALAAGAYRLAGTPYSMPGTKTLGVDMGKSSVPGILKQEPEVRLGDNTGPVSIGFPLKDDAKVFVDEARIIASDGKTILDKAKSIGRPGEFVFGGTDKSYPEGAFVVYKLSNGKSFHMPLRTEPTA